MTSEPIPPPSTRPAKALSALLIVDAESLLARYPDPSLDPDNPTVIDAGFVLAISGNAVGKKSGNDSKLTLPMNIGDECHLRGRSISLIAEHSVVFYAMDIGDSSVLSAPKLVVKPGLTVPAPDPANPTEPGSHQADDHYWHCSATAKGSTPCRFDFMLVNQRCEVAGCFSWSVELVITQ
ncbi:AidA/PixA family protein [Pseudomonas sp. NPDC089534]|uniref:AidA/PixA family protein n=1 Tax=Pseudomonas sp. NPDC089534 TaxID=3364468 RepID=UPI00382BF6F1